MTRKKALKDIVEREALQMALGLTDIEELLLNGHVGYNELTNTEVEDKYREIINKEITIE